MKYKYGFTLAEVLITLGIIGVVAAMTLPTLIQNYQKQEVVSRLKKAYSVISQATERSKVDNGDIDQWEWDLRTTDFFDKYITNNMQLTQNCKLGQGCWNSSNAIFDLNGNIAESITPYYRVQLSDGTSVAMVNQYGTSPTDNHAHILVDINGNKGPNKYGKDCFAFTLTASASVDYAHKIDKAGLYFFGHGLNRDELINNQGSCKRKGNGRFCGEMLLMDGWEFKEDYPW